MSEHQCYEFVALDHPLTDKQMNELRAISSRAEISPMRFWSEYQWGNLKADPAKLMARYFDAHLYFANWGTHRLMLRVPKARVDVKALRACFVGRYSAHLTIVGQHVVLDFQSDDEEADYNGETEVSLAALSPLRAELMRGDLRSAYLAWLLAVQAGDVKDDAREPPVPNGLATLTAAQQTMVEFLRLDDHLLGAAASGSARITKNDRAFRRWVMQLPAATKEKWLLRAVGDPDLALGGEMLRAFYVEQGTVEAARRRTAGELQHLAEVRRAKRRRPPTSRGKKAR